MSRSKKNRANQGLHANRLKKSANNPREVAFAEQWEREHLGNGGILDSLVRVPCSDDDPQRAGRDVLQMPYKLPIGNPTDRDRLIAATVFQWLGSNVGFSSLQEALGRCGYEIKRKG